MLVIFIIILVLGVAGIAINYTTMARDYEENEQTLRNMTEAYLSSSFHRIDTGLKMYDNTYNDQMREGFSIVMAEYNRSGGDPSRMNLERLKEATGMSVYIINQSGVIEYSTSIPDIGLDFSIIYPDFYQYLQRIWHSPGFYPDRIVTEWVSGALTKFAYMPTHDHRYVIEVGLASERITAERKGLRYGDVREEAQEFNPFIEEIRIWQKQKRVVGNSSYQPDDTQSEVLDTILRDRTSHEFPDPDGSRVTRWLFVDMLDPKYAADMSLIVEIVYSKAKVQHDLQLLVLFHILVAGVVLLGGGGLAFILSRRLSRPIQGIVEDVDRIAKGDLEHNISRPAAEEFERIAQSINAMVETLKGSITQLQQSEDALKKSQERYRSVVETQTEMIARFLPDGTHVFTNEAYCAYFNLPCTQIIGTRFKPLIPPDERAMLREYFAAFTPDRPVGTIEHRIILPGGEVRWQQWNDRAIFGPSGGIIEFQSVGRDITEKKLMESALRESETNYRTLVESANSIILRFRADGTITFANPYALSFFGFRKDSLVGKNLMETIVPEFDSEGANLREKILDLAVHPERYRTSQNENVTREQKRVWVSWTNTPLFDAEGNVEEILSIGNDITRIKEMEDELQQLNEMLEQKVVERTSELEDANRELEAFSYSVSHDLRAPLRAIDGFSYMIISKYSSQLPGDAIQYLERIRHNISYMGQLIDAILNFSRMSRQPLITQTIFPSAMVKEILDELLASKGERKVEITQNDLPPLTGDPALVRQVFSNLLSNALKFTKIRKTARIEVGSTVRESRSVYYIRDNGIGFDMQYRDKIFGVFQRLHPAMEYEGAGIGLTIVQRIIQRHRGIIWVESEVDKGTTFYFSFEPGPRE
ncbi:MAG: sensory histidine kinase AtoS [Methanoregulaceae archaeon PtaB.Bin009]|jgi:PAS domain S-box-containing protein|nr:MAG: sensory histidine kinase AtoS [Methanoregulaceae archaeon PtaB.Bin009]OPY38800.1 MAG: sensory histidine kinase AtoS [Methanoregulaceae archaeon PtaU1.Bin066]HNQ28789.1 PAS domain S-box protein [Methanolinea sp.]